MIRVTVELWPHGDKSRKWHLGTAIIANDGTGTEEIGNYRVTLSKWGRPQRVWRRGRVEGFPRKSRGPWDLLYRALQATVGARAPAECPGDRCWACGLDREGEADG